MSQNSLLAGAGAAGAAVAAGPLAEVFSEMGLVMAIMGAIGGALYGMIKRNPPWLAWAGRLVLSSLSGAILAFGLGVFVPPVLIWSLGLEITPSGQSTGLLAAGAFLVGLMQERVFAFLGAAKGDDNEPE